MEEILWVQQFAMKLTSNEKRGFIQPLEIAGTNILLNFFLQLEQLLQYIDFAISQIYWKWTWMH